jgi:hypothetical protein
MNDFKGLGLSHPSFSTRTILIPANSENTVSILEEVDTRRDANQVLRTAFDSTFVLLNRFVVSTLVACRCRGVDSISSQKLEKL